jgi:glutamate racemase
MTLGRSCKRIGIYDSGVGGLSIAACVQVAIPDAHYFYLCDNLNFPYGTKPDDEVIAFAIKNSLNFVETYQIDILVIACNTASTVALEAVRSAVKIPVVGVVPAIKPAALLSKSKSIGLLATPATVKRPYTRKLIDDFSNGCKVTLQGSSVLVDIAEKKLRAVTISKESIKTEVDQLLIRDPAIDVIVLGCTHFPLLKDELVHLFPNIAWVDSGNAIASRVKSLYSTIDSEKRTTGKEGCIAVFTAETETAHSLRSALIPFGFLTTAFLKFSVKI